MKPRRALPRVKPPAEEVVDLQLAATEFGPNPFPNGMYFVFGQSHNRGGDSSGALVVLEKKRPGQRVCAVPIQGDGAAFYVDLFHWEIGAARPVR